MGLWLGGLAQAGGHEHSKPQRPGDTVDLAKGFQLANRCAHTHCNIVSFLSMYIIPNQVKRKVVCLFVLLDNNTDVV